jgi:carbon-monoxide dehydrogenase medium subunit
MLLPRFNFHDPLSMEEACQIMAEYGLKAKIIAGGTDLMVNMKKKLFTPEQLVSVSRLKELKKIEKKDDIFTIGAGVTVVELAESAKIKNQLSALNAGAKSLGSPLVRNRATIGGNLASARPAADLPPSLMCYGSRVVLKNRDGKRTVPLDKFFLGPGFTTMGPEEILTEIQVDIPPPGSGAGYLQLGVRKAQDCNIVNAGSFISLDEKSGEIKKARVVLGCVGPTHIRAITVEKRLIGEKPGEKLFQKAAQDAKGECAPIDDFRGCSDYKKQMVGVLTFRTLELALREARKGS